VPEPAACDERFEVVSRGDPVPGRLWLGEGPAPRPLVLLVPALGAHKDSSDVRALSRALAADGWAAAAIDLPLQGERASPKLSARLAACAAAERRRDGDRLLWDEFVRQAARDLSAVRRNLALRAGIRGEAVACVAHASAAAPARAWAAQDPSVTLLIPDRLAVAEVLGPLHEALAAR
jgi:dienelactone hydrolase